MMSYSIHNGFLLDTHSFLWSVWAPEKLGMKALDVLENTNNRIFVSNISFWEIALKYSLGKLVLGCKPDDLLAIAKELQFEQLTLDFSVTALFYQLPQSVHKDPFDRMLIWQAMAKGLPLISKDHQFNHYLNSGLQTIW